MHTTVTDGSLQIIIIIKKQIKKKLHIWCTFWSKGVVKLNILEGNMNSEKYIDILESSFWLNEFNFLHNRSILQWNNYSKHIMKKSLCFYMKTKKDWWNGQLLVQILILLKTSWETLRLFMIKSIFKHIKF